MLKNEDPSFGESFSLNFPSDHQKSLLVDYGTEKAHGYVMGHNSLTAYWDTVEMRHDEPLREAGLGPWHDFSIGIKGSGMIIAKKIIFVKGMRKLLKVEKSRTWKK